MMFKCVFFDMDGTILNTLHDLSEALNSVLKIKNMPIRNIEEYKYIFGDGIYEAVRKALPRQNNDEIIINECVELMKVEYSKRWTKKTKPYDGINQLLEYLKNNNYKIVILTNKPHEAANHITKAIFKNFKFDGIYGATNEYPKKPDPTLALEIVENLNIEPCDCIFVGDTDVDMKTAKNANMYPVGVTWGFRDKKELVENGAKMIIDHPLELIKLIERK